MPDDFLERIRKTVGEDARLDLEQLDRDNDLHVDRAAAALHRRFLETDDVEAWKLLCDLTEDRLCALAEEVAREQGLLDDPSELVVRYFEELMVDLRPAPRGAESFLRRARDAMRVDAETWVRDIALSSARDPGIPQVWDDGHPTPEPADLAQRATRIAFHRLDQPYRRVLRAKDVEDLSTEQIAERLTLTPAEVDDLLAEASLRLAAAVDRELEGGPR